MTLAELRLALQTLVRLTMSTQIKTGLTQTLLTRTFNPRLTVTLGMTLLTRPVARKAAAAAIRAAASIFHSFVTTVVLTNMDSAVASFYKVATA